MGKKPLSLPGSCLRAPQAPNLPAIQRGKATPSAGTLDLSPAQREWALLCYTYRCTYKYIYTCCCHIPQGSLYPSVGNILLLLCVSAQSRLTLCDPMNCSLPGSSVHGIIQARRLEQVTISFSRGSSWTGDGTLVSCISRWVLYNWATREAQYYLVIVYINFLLFKLLFLFADWTLTQNWYQK